MYTLCNYVFKKFCVKEQQFILNADRLCCILDIRKQFVLC